MFSVLGIAAVAAEAITLLRQERGTLFGISIPGEVQLALFLIGDILLMVYVFWQASRATEADIRLAAAHETLSLIKNGIRPPSADESELAFELRVTIECVRFGMNAIEQSGIPLDQLRRARLSVQDTLDSLEAARQNLQRSSPFG
jgi:hypothetical protein